MIARYWRRFLLAMSFGTVLPVSPRRARDDDIRLSAGYLPLVGSVLGLMLWGISWITRQWFPIPVSAIIAVAAYTLLTGGLHLDGLMDTWDAIGSRQRGEAALQIMKDSRVGAMGVAAAVILLLGKYAAFSRLNVLTPGPWVLVPLIARTAAVWSMAVTPPARSAGLGVLFARKVPRSALLVSTALVLMMAATGVAFGLVRAIALLPVILLTGLLVAGSSPFCRRRFGGTTGDTYGALIETIEWTGFLLLTGGLGHGG